MAQVDRNTDPYMKGTGSFFPLRSMCVKGIPTRCVVFVRWSRREQMDFYRTVSSFGVAFDPERKAFDWSQFRVLARLERKTDDSLERYFNSFVSMCRAACKLPPRKEEGDQ